MTKVIMAVACIAGMVALAFAVRPAHAQGFLDEPTCYSWNGGNFSSGSFSKCQHWEVAKAPPPTPPAPVVVPAPVMQNIVACPPATPVPLQTHKARPKKPPVKCNP
jgi:hypothetical protein